MELYFFRLFAFVAEAHFAGGTGGARPVFCNQLFFCIHFEELKNVLIEVKLIINNAPLTYFCQNTIKTCLTPNNLLFADSYHIILTQHQL